MHRALLLTHQGRHGLCLATDEPEPIFIRCGFTSGYAGEGPRGLAVALQLLRTFNVETEKIEVRSSLLDRLDNAAMRYEDWGEIQSGRIVRPIRIYDYMHDGARSCAAAERSLLKLLFVRVPWSILDPRLIDLAMVMGSDPDRAVFEAFRRLESIVKDRCEMPPEVHGVQVFKKAFRGQGAMLSWPGIASSEVEGRAQLFEAAFMAYRNPRAHREVDGGSDRAFSEFCVVNELFALEAAAKTADQALGS
jgi:hypothetical protein